MWSCWCAGCPAAEVVHTRGINTADEARAPASQHGSGWARQQERMEGKQSRVGLLSFETYIQHLHNCTRKGFSVFCFENVWQAELQWKLEECNRLRGECKVPRRPVSLTASPKSMNSSCTEFVVNWRPQLFLHATACCVQKEMEQKDRLVQQLKHKLEETQVYLWCRWTPCTLSILVFTDS